MAQPARLRWFTRLSPNCLEYDEKWVQVQGRNIGMDVYLVP